MTNFTGEPPSANFTGTLRGPVETDPRTGEQFRAVIEYERGWCVDKFVTIVRTERMVRNGYPA